MKAQDKAQTSAQETAQEIAQVSEAVNLMNEISEQLETLSEEEKQEINTLVDLLNGFEPLPITEVVLLSEEEQNNYFDLLQIYNNVKKAQDRKSGLGAYERYINKFDYILLLIYNSGLDGFTVEQMVKSGKSYIDKKGTKSGYSLGQICTQWNTANTVKQRGYFLLTNPTSLEPDTKREAINCNIMAISEAVHPSSFLAKANKRTNNRIIITSGAENVRTYLLERGAKAIEGTNELSPNFTKAV